jgi:hypothetical protein
VPGLSPAELLAAWERGRTQSLPERALTMLCAAEDGGLREDFVKLRVGRRDAALLALREATFGARLVALASCPACGEQVELAFDADDVRVEAGADPAPALSVVAGGSELCFRLPTAGDLVAIAGADDVDEAERLLVVRCVLAGDSGRAPAPERLPEEAIRELADGMAEADPQADVELALRCPACGGAWRSPFDIASFLWREVAARARTLLRDVHTLAAAYGWSETDILALSPGRRQAYLDLALA